MDYIFVHNQAEVTTDRAGGRLSWISGTHERTALQHRAITRDACIFTTGPEVM